MEAFVPEIGGLAVLSLLLVSLAKTQAHRLHLLDRPGGRKQHLGNIPTVGGISIYLAFLFGMAFEFDLLKTYGVLLAGMGLLVLVGALDDALDLSSTTKLCAQLAAAGLIAWAGAMPLFTFGHIFHSQELTLLGDVVLTVFMAVWIVNAINMVDGVDGLAGGAVVVSLAWLGVGAILTGSGNTVSVILRLIVPVCAFLTFNHRTPWRKRASVFMGDAGTLMLGFALTWFCLELRARGGFPMLACTLVIAIPLTDVVSLFFRRLYAGQNPFKGDRQHLHHLLEAVGVPAEAIPLLVNGASAVIGGFGILGSYFELPSAAFAITWMAVVAGHTVLVGLLLARIAVGASNRRFVPASEL
jgi:UDP-GlcNAc:undecaprenyl-phosphate GlcNAc-1-phosphate transferase